jgi:glycosyltransferase involved in cell wall biosynthesis
MEPIAHGIAARGHDVHVVAPWHPLLRRNAQEGRVRFHFFRYAPHPALTVFGYASAMRADVTLRGAAWVAAPLALAAGWRVVRRVVRQVDATVVHGHWVVPGGALAAAAARGRPLIISLHGSDVYVAERYAIAGAAARRVFRRAGWITACSDDLRTRAIALGAPDHRIETVPYGVDAARFKPNPASRAARRNALGLQPDQPLLFAAGRLVHKKGFEYLLDALARSAGSPRAHLAIAGEGDLDRELRDRAARLGLGERVSFLGRLDQDDVAEWLSAADVAVVPSVHDEAGNVDGLPNTVLEALASGTPLIATPAGGIGSVVEDGRTGLIVPERDPIALAGAIDELLRDPLRRASLGAAARAAALMRHGWGRVAERFEEIYDQARRARAIGSPR